MNELKYIELGKIAKIEASGVDKKIKDSEEFVKLCNFVDIYRNWAITKKMNDSFMDGSANQNEIAKFALKKGQVAITKDSETRDDIGMSAYIADDFDKTVLGYHCTLITPDPLVLNGKYLNAYLNSPTARKYFSNQASGSGQRYTLTSEAVGKVKVPLIKLSEQIVIGELFSTIDKKIQLNKQINDNLSEQIRDIYNYWFYQYEFPNGDGKPYKSCKNRMMYSNVLKKDIPENWNVKKLKDCILHINTGLNPRDNFKLGNGNIRYITVKNLTSNGTIDFENCDVIGDEARSIVHNRSQVSKGDVLFASIAPLGRCYVVNDDPTDWDINESVFSIRPNISLITSEYLYLYLTSDDFVKKAEHSATGSVFSGIRISTLEDMYITVPDFDTLTQFSSKTDALFAMRAKLSAENEKLKQLRDFLLPLLMNGQIAIE